MDGGRIILVLLSSTPHFMPAQTVRRQIRISPQRIKCTRVEGIRVFRDVFQGDSFYPAYGSRKITVDNFSGNSDRLEYFRSLVGLNRGNPHFRGYFYDSMEDGMGVVLHRRVILLVQKSLFNQFAYGLYRKVWIYRTGAIP